MKWFFRFYTYDLLNCSGYVGAYKNNKGFVYHADKIADQLVELSLHDQVDAVYLELIDEPEFKNNKYVQEFIDKVCSSSKIKISIKGHCYTPRNLLVNKNNQLDVNELREQTKPMICLTPWSKPIFEPKWYADKSSQNNNANFYVGLNLSDTNKISVLTSDNLCELHSLKTVLTRPYYNWYYENNDDIIINSSNNFMYGQQISYVLYRYITDIKEISKAYEDAASPVKEVQSCTPLENSMEGQVEYGSWL